MLTEAEVCRRFPEVYKIEDKNLREETMFALQHVPDYFWDVPASSSKKYHNPYGRMQHGLWIHVKMAFVMAERYIPSYINMNLINEYEADCIRSALLLHDMFKQGYPEDRIVLASYKRHTVDNHDVLASKWLATHTALPQAVVNAVDRHNGGWYEGGEPESWVEHLVHLSDMAASTANCTIGVYKPAMELTSKYPTLPRAIL